MSNGAGKSNKKNMLYDVVSSVHPEMRIFVQDQGLRKT
jgi:hypothetical protein